jgi:predicted O-methyltransferase YrrM
LQSFASLVTLSVPFRRETWREIERIPGRFSEYEIRGLAFAASVAMQTTQGAILEIGSYKGQATVALGKVAQAIDSHRRIYAVDPGTGDWIGAHSSHWEELLSNLANAGLDGKVHCIRCVPSMAGFSCPEPLALALINGAHGLREVRRDFEMIAPHVLGGGVAAFHHDCASWPGVTMHCQQIERLYRWILVMKVETLTVFFKPAA